ncbi:MAG: ATP-dependent RNA helicase HrpA [Phycisphaeraceae bacterium]|nr:ATP-dependent RNA helicase HrpA [Phycisphaeraceae bacterium]
MLQDQSIADLYPLLDECTLADAARLRRRLRSLAGGRGRDGRDRRDRRGRPAPSERSSGDDHPARSAAPDPRVLEQLRFDIDLARERLTRRRERMPRPSFEMDLPIIARRDEIEAAIREHRVIVLCGETGSGKSTQLPKMCLSAGRGVRGMIGHTQPRRIAARSVAARLAEELRTSVGREVGFKVRFGDRTGDDTFIKVMTDGILLAETQGDRLLEQYDTLIIDEAHERSLNIDFLLGYLRTLLERRRDLKVIVTSATIDPERFSRHFGAGGAGAPIIEVSGRTYPVEVRYRPLVVDEGEHAGQPTSFMGDPGDAERDLEAGVLDAIDELAHAGSGDVLVFLPGEREIREIAEALRKHHPPQTEILPLFARLSAEEQERVFKPHPYRRIVLATNVAETSLTVPGIRYVVDSGLARISRYSARTKVLGLPIEAISQASAAQRSGRCGRVAAGVAIRLYSEEDFAKRPAFTEPEILRTNLAGAILQMKALRLGEPERFPFVEAPEARRLKDGYETLHELGAIDEQGALTALGERLSRLPVDPRIGRMVLAGADEKCLDDLLIIAAALSIQDPRDRPLDRREAADQAHRRFEDPASDFVTFLNIWREYHEQSRHLSRRKLVAWCKGAFLSFVRMREWHETHNQLRALVKQIGVQGASASSVGRGERRRSPRQLEATAPTAHAVRAQPIGENPTDAHERPEARATNSLTPSHRDAIHRALLAGLLSSVGKKGEQHEYDAPRQASFAIHPASVLFKHSPGWVMAAEVVQTTRRYARIVAPVEPGWIERAAGHLVRRTYSEAHWDSRRQNVLAFEKVLLFGLEVIAGRAVSFGPIDPVAAREVFIRHALVEGDLRPRPRFLDRNLALEEEVRTLEAKARRRDLLADAAAKEAFYLARVPEGVVNQATFDRWFKRAGHEQPGLLDMRVEDLLLASADRPARDLYPDELDVDGTPLAVKYRYEPGTSGDGLTLRVPLELLGKVSEQRAEWLVPGLLEEKVVELVRLLAKETRRVLGPAPGFATEFVRAAHARGDTLVEALSRFAERRFGVRIGADQWRIGELPEHLRMNFQVVGKGGKALKESRRLGEIKTALRISNVRFLDLGDARYTGSGYRDWEFGDLPAFVEATRAGVAVRGYPAVVDEGETAGVRLCDTEAAAGMLMRAGLRRLYMLVASEDIRRLKKDFPPMEKVAAMHASLVHATGAAAGKASATGSKGSGLLDEVIGLIADRAFFGASTGAGGSGATNPTSIRTRARFDAAVVAAIDRLYQAAEDVPALVVRILEAHHAAALRLEQAAPGGKAPAGWEASLDDVRAQVGALVSPGFLLRTPERWLRHVPRYLAGVQRRLDRLRAGGEAGVKKDREQMGLLGPWVRKYAERAKGLAERGTVDPELETFRWMIEEYRVSLFAQDLGTSGPVSPKRLEGQFEKVRV